jgi:hypothetical protein
MPEIEIVLINTLEMPKKSAAGAHCFPWIRAIHEYIEVGEFDGVVN